MGNFDKCDVESESGRATIRLLSVILFKENMIATLFAMILEWTDVLKKLEVPLWVTGLIFVSCIIPFANSVFKGREAYPDNVKFFIYFLCGLVLFASHLRSASVLSLPWLNFHYGFVLTAVGAALVYYLSYLPIFPRIRKKQLWYVFPPIITAITIAYFDNILPNPDGQNLRYVLAATAVTSISTTLTSIWLAEPFQLQF